MQTKDKLGKKMLNELDAVTQVLPVVSNTLILDWDINILIWFVVTICYFQHNQQQLNNSTSYMKSIHKNTNQL